MHRSGKFDVTDDTAAHVTDSRPIRKSLQQLRPDKLFRCSTKDTVKLSLTASDGTLSTTETGNNGHIHETDVAVDQPQPEATASKSSTEYQRNRSFERTGSLRDRWRQLNDEFKRLYQTTPSQGHAPAPQGQTKVRKVNRFKDIDRRFSKVSRAVGNMSARQIHNTTSGRTDSSDMMSPKPEVVRSATSRNEREVCVSEIATKEGIVSDPGDQNAHLYTDGETDEYLEPITRRRSLSEQNGHYLPATGPISWYPDSQSTGNMQSRDNRPSTSMYGRHAGSSNSEWRQQTMVLPPGECKCNTVCKYCGMTSTAAAAAVGSQPMKIADQQPFRMVIYTTLYCVLVPSFYICCCQLVR